MSVEDLLRYGEWSGPGWTAGLPADFFEDRGLGRKLTDVDLAINGIDRYDNFVAKAHDINEFRAQRALREVLAPLGLVDNTVETLPGGREGYRERLRYGSGGQDLKRFVSFHHYADQLRGQGPGNAELSALGHGFALYFQHLIYSNLQFAIDCVLNDVSHWRNVKEGAFRMSVQLRVAPHWFMGEAHRLELAFARIWTELGIPVIPDAQIRAYLDTHLVSPGLGFFKPVKDEPHIPALTPAALIADDRDNLTDVFPPLLEAKTTRGRKRLARHIGNFRPEGCHSVAELSGFLEQYMADP